MKKTISITISKKGQIFKRARKKKDKPLKPDLTAFHILDPYDTVIPVSEVTL